MGIQLQFSKHFLSGVEELYNIYSLSSAARTVQLEFFFLFNRTNDSSEIILKLTSM